MISKKRRIGDMTCGQIGGCGSCPRRDVHPLIFVSGKCVSRPDYDKSVKDNLFCKFDLTKVRAPIALKDYLEQYVAGMKEEGEDYA